MTRIFSLSALVVISGLALSGCAPSVARLAVSEADKPRFNALLADPTALRAFLADTTIKNWDSRYGTQIEYHSVSGRTWLVFPGNLRSLQGFWKITGPAGNPRICYLYPHSRDAITGKPGGDWECGPAALKLTADEIRDGDVLGLQKQGLTPYPKTLPAKYDISISEVVKALGLRPLRQKNKTFEQDGS
ncbi:hypothetical protein [Pseudooceanicola spongiae]|uniref:Uncharacterized protein n=1 Tax=Pseudooceanicola spongiae TaxID=2613965 RepID=A0A7L9WRX1_9RHOB|nr:hypothetical protein [Pseudooceanicola spongiae]QOL82622.1 hypothetical protein F3W81_18425 [Pseudooceanicola spongiae]